MNPIDKILYQTITVPFYRQIGGAMLFLFFILFGMQQSLSAALAFHYYLIRAIIEKPIGLPALALLMAAFTVKCGLFIAGTLQKKPFGFLRTLNALHKRKKFAHLIRMAATMLIPILFYGMIVAAIAFKTGAAVQAVLTLFIMSVCAVALSVFISKTLMKEHSLTPGRSFNIALFRLPKNLTWFILNFVFKKQFRALFVVKVLSFVALYFFVQHDDTVFEERMLSLIFMLGIAGHGVIIYKNFQFTETHFRFYRNMPLAQSSLLISLLFVYIFMFLPELWALRALGFLHHNWYAYFSMIAAGPLILLLLHALLYTEDMAMEAYLPLLFGVCLIFYFFFFSQNKWLVPAVAAAGSALIFYTAFRRFERKTETEKLE